MFRRGIESVLLYSLCSPVCAILNKQISDQGFSRCEEVGGILDKKGTRSQGAAHGSHANKEETFRCIAFCPRLSDPIDSALTWNTLLISNVIAASRCIECLAAASPGRPPSLVLRQLHRFFLAFFSPLCSSY